MVHTIEILYEDGEYEVTPQPEDETYYAYEVALNIETHELHDNILTMAEGLFTLNIEQDKRFKIDESESGKSLTVSIEEVDDSTEPLW